MDPWVVAILPLFGVMVGAAMQFLFGRAAERNKQAENLRAQAYSDYLRAVAAAGHLARDEDFRNAQRDAADTKARISVYGSARVIKALAQFEEVGPVLNNDRSTRAFVSLVTSMRPSRESISARELELVLFGRRG